MRHGQPPSKVHLNVLLPVHEVSKAATLVVLHNQGVVILVADNACVAQDWDGRQKRSIRFPITYTKFVAVPTNHDFLGLGWNLPMPAS
jgi:hypothetical protein